MLCAHLSKIQVGRRERKRNNVSAVIMIAGLRVASSRFLAHDSSWRFNPSKAWPGNAAWAWLFTSSAISDETYVFFSLPKVFEWRTNVTSFSSLGRSLELQVGPEFLLLQFLFLLVSMLFTNRFLPRAYAALQKWGLDSALEMEGKHKSSWDSGFYSWVAEKN